MIGKQYKYITVILFGASVLVGQAFAYDNEVVHPEMAKSSIEIYNNQTNKKITLQQADWIVEGVIAEDTFPRFENHFYNPSTGKGLNDGGFTGKPATEWLMEQDSISGDYSIPAILENYRNGDKKRAYQGIGHTLHLIQDMAQPAHTRNDAHPTDAIYEIWAERNTKSAMGCSGGIKSIKYKFKKIILDES